jgi:hypothetical protein
VDTALGRLAADPRHPSLRVKKLQGSFDVWEARASDELRITFELIDRGLRLRNVGHHDATLKAS